MCSILLFNLLHTNFLNGMQYAVYTVHYSQLNVHFWKQTGCCPGGCSVWERQRLGLHTRRASHDGCCGILSFLYPFDKMEIKFSWTHFTLYHNKRLSKRTTLTRYVIQYETKQLQHVSTQ